MTHDRAVDCDGFDVLADELALGQVEEPVRGRLLAHASSCARCTALLDGLGLVADRLLLVAPEIEPPAGFETRALARLGVADTARPRRTGWRLPAAVAAAVVLAVVAFAIGRAGSGDAARSAAIAAPSGAVIGSVRLDDRPSPHVLVSIDAPRAEPGVRHCELQRPDGSWVRVGSWELADIEAGTWATGVERELLAATEMRIVTEDGSVLATAVIDAR